MEILKILILEDDPNDVEFIKQEIVSNIEYKCIFKCVVAKNDFQKELTHFYPDIILSDFNLPQFNGLDALKFSLDQNIIIPFIIVTGTLTEEVAAESIKEGAWDYVVKERLHRLPQAITNALKLKHEKLRVRKAEHELNLIKEKSGIQLRILYDAIDRAPSSFVITDKKGTIQYVNPKFEEVTGYKKEEVVGENPRILKSGYHNSIYYKKLWDTILTGKEFRGEIVNKKKNGDLYWEMVSISAIRNEKNEIEYFVAVKRDITDAKKIQEELISSEEKFRLITTSAQDAIIMIDHNGETTYWNPAATKIFGYSEEEILGEKIHYIIAPSEFLEEHKSGFIKYQQTGFGKYLGKTIELEAIKKDGTRFPVELSLSGMNLNGEKGAVGILRDISERKKAEEELIKAKEKAEESDRLKSTFLATMSHELRTPLNAIIGFSDLIPDQDSREKMIEMSKIINTSGNHLLKIIEDIFEISILQTKESKVVKEDFKISELFDLLEQYANIEQKKKQKENLNIIFHTNENMLLINSDKKKVKQLLINLISNSIEYTQKGFIEIGFTLNDKDITFFVKDTGQGIPEDKIDIIFDLFRQVDESHTRLHGGIGIGLSICKEITNLLDGTLKVESKINEGTTFYFTLPNAIVENQELPVSPGLNISTNFQNKTILVVEDIESNIILLQNLLEPTGAKIIDATNGIQAIETCRNIPEIELILMDIHMPGIDGFEATRRIKKFRPDIKIIAQTALAMPNDKEMALAAGCDAYIAKPYKLFKLLELIEKFLKVK